MKKNYFSILKAVIFTAALAMVAGNASAFTNITAQEAYDMVCSGEADLIDVRTLEEAVWVGSPACEAGGDQIAYLIPWEFWDGVDKDGKSIMKENHNFNSLMLKTFGEPLKDPIIANRGLITMCRSGGRSTAAAKQLEDLGYTNVYEIDNILKEMENGTGGNGGFQGSSYSNKYDGYRGYPERLPSESVATDTDEIKTPNDSVSWMDIGLPVTQKIDPRKVPKIKD